MRKPLDRVLTPTRRYAYRCRLEMRAKQEQKVHLVRWKGLSASATATPDMLGELLVAS